MALFLFFLAKAVLTSLPTTHLVTLRLHFSVWQSHCVQAFLLKLAPFCKLFTGLGSTNKTVTSLRLALSLLCFPPPFCFTLWQSGRSYLFYPPLVSIYNGSPVAHFFWVVTRPMSWPGGMRCSSCPRSHVFYLSYSLFSRTGAVLFYQNASMHKCFPTSYIGCSRSNSAPNQSTQIRCHSIIIPLRIQSLTKNFAKQHIFFLYKRF